MQNGTCDWHWCSRFQKRFGKIKTTKCYKQVLSLRKINVYFKYGFWMLDLFGSVLDFFILMGCLGSVLDLFILIGCLGSVLEFVHFNGMSRVSLRFVHFNRMSRVSFRFVHFNGISRVSLRPIAPNWTLTLIYSWFIKYIRHIAIHMFPNGPPPNTS